MSHTLTVSNFGMLNPIVAEDLQRIHRGVGRRIERLRNSTVVVTGCAGFLGFYFMHYLAHHAGEIGVRRIFGLDSFLLNKPQWLSVLEERFTDIVRVYAFDVSRDDPASIEGADRAEFVIHMASIASPTFYRRFPVETLDANVWGLRRLLETWRRSETLRGLLFFSSSEIYGDPDPGQIPTPEEYRGNVACNGPRACYDEAKRFGETMCYVFAKTYDMPVIIARPFNNYGPGMRLDDRRLPADFAKCVLDNRDIVILSDGSPTRTFCYISDAITGYLLCLLHGSFDYFNIGIERPEISVRELAKVYQSAGKELFGYRGEVLYRTSADAEYLTDNPNRRCPSIDKARAILGYAPGISVEDGVRRYLKFLDYERTAGA